jgi:DNA-binding HxlR family transcriptional regulator
MASDTAGDTADAFDIGRIDEVIHGRVRLGIMAYLSGVGTADFNELKARLQATDGNLSVHLRKLEEAGFVEVAKSFQGRKPLTRATMTEAGRDAFVAYLEAMSGLVGAR